MDRNANSDAQQSPSQEQARHKVVEFFDARAADWQSIYERPDVFSVIHQERMALVLNWVDELALPAGSRVLEIGCGAGLVTVALACRGFFVSSMDTAPAMIERARRLASDAGAADRVVLSLGDAHQLAFRDGEFRLALAVGVVPWLHTPQAALRELARVVEPGGYFLGTCDNRWRLQLLFDPTGTPLLSPVRSGVKSFLQHASAWSKKEGAEARRHSRPEFDRMLAAAGFEKLRDKTYGFGPFSFFGYLPLRRSRAVGVHRKLQGLADRGWPLFRATGSQYIVLARKTLASGGEGAKSIA